MTFLDEMSQNNVFFFEFFGGAPGERTQCLNASPSKCRVTFHKGESPKRSCQQHRRHDSAQFIRQGERKSTRCPQYIKERKHFHQEDIRTVWIIRFPASQPPTPAAPASPFSPPSHKEMKMMLKNILQKNFQIQKYYQSYNKNNKKKTKSQILLMKDI